MLQKMRTHGLPLQLLISDWRRKSHIIDDLSWLSLRTAVHPIRDGALGDLQN